MRVSRLLGIFVLALPVVGQSWFIPDNNAALGTCNVIPFGGTGPGSFANAVFQTKATVADLGGVPGVITGLGFASCSSGVAHFDSIEVILDHHPAGTALGTTFAANLTPNAQVVLSATDYTWNLTANAWNEIGLQGFFVWNGVDDLVVQITLVNSTAPLGFHRDVRQRVYWTGAAGPAPATGSSGAAAAKWEVSMLGARLSTYGRGCTGSSAQPLLHTLTGSAQLGQTIQFGVGNGVPFGAGFLLLGFYQGTPFPLDLGFLGMPGCLQYFASATTQFVPLDAVGSGSTPLAVPNVPAFAGILMWSQHAAIDPTANTAGVTTSNYGRVLVGN